MSDNNKGIKIIRKRYFPNEEIDISGDTILHLDDELLVTKWVPIKPRPDMARGISLYFLKEGYKISKIFDKDDNLVYYYCDVCRYEVKGNTYKMIDLLVDVIIYEDKHYEVVDFEELVDMFERKDVPPKEFIRSIKNFSSLITLINEGKFPYDLFDKYK